MFNKDKFRGAVISNGFTMELLANKINVNLATLYRKINRNGDFSREEIAKITEVLDLERDEVYSIFFG